MPSFGITLGSETGETGSIASKQRNDGSRLSTNFAKCVFIDDAQHNNIQHLSASGGQTTDDNYTLSSGLTCMSAEATGYAYENFIDALNDGPRLPDIHFS